jgi:hypothetical protein
MKPFIIIAGMHRSGTSFLSRALNLSGVYLGSLESLTLTELNADQSNPRGHWENREFIRLGIETRKFNEWSNSKEIPDQIKISEKIEIELKNVIKELMTKPSIAAGFKDPRSLLYLSEWLEFFPKNTIIVSIFRHPLKVAESLKIRDGRSYDESLRLWKSHNQGLLKALEKHQGFVLNFDWSKERMFEEITTIREKIGLLQVDLSDWYTDELKRSDKTFEENYPLDNEIEEIYEKLKEFSEKNKNILIDKYVPSYEEIINILISFYGDSKNQIIYFKKLSDELKRTSNETEKLSAEKIFNLELTLQEKQKQINDLENTIKTLQNNLNNIQQSKLWKIARKYDELTGKK